MCENGAVNASHAAKQSACSIYIVTATRWPISFQFFLLFLFFSFLLIFFLFRLVQLIVKVLQNTVCWERVRELCCTRITNSQSTPSTVNVYISSSSPSFSTETQNLIPCPLDARTRTKQREEFQRKTFRWWSNIIAWRIVTSRCAQRAKFNAMRKRVIISILLAIWPLVFFFLGVSSVSDPNAFQIHTKIPCVRFGV